MEIKKRDFSLKVKKSTILGKIIEEKIKNYNKKLDSNALITSTKRKKRFTSFNEKINRKGYENPLNDTTDYYGIRYVYLFDEHVKKITDYLNSDDDLDVSIDRSYIHEKREKPNYFDYQSNHLVISLVQGANINGVIIDSSIKCEVQLRNIFQHAYAEVSHDLMYKKENGIDLDLKRKLYQAVALSEATNDIFASVKETIDKEVKEIKSLEKYLNEVSNLKKNTYDEDFNKELIKFIFEKFKNDREIEPFKHFLNVEKESIENIIKKIKDKKYIVPAIWGVIYLTKKNSTWINQNWMYDTNPISIIHYEFGIAMG